MAAEETPQRLIQRAYKTELAPTPEQVKRLYQHAGACRFVYNWALARKNESRARWVQIRDERLAQINEALGPVPEGEEGKPERDRRRKEANAHASGQVRIPTAMATAEGVGLNRALTALKNQEETAWLYTVNNSALQNAIRHVDAAYMHFFRRLAEGKTGREAGEPRFKSRAQGVVPFKLNGAIHVYPNAVRLPTLGTLVLKEQGYLPTQGARITSATISEAAGRWYVSLQVEECIPELHAIGPVLAVHQGVRVLATVRDEQGREFRIENPRALARVERKLKKAQRALARKQKGSANRQKARLKLAKVHLDIANARHHALHQATTMIVRQAGALIVEDWDVKAMFGEHRIAQRLGDAAMGEFRRQLMYKADWRGVPVLITPRGFPSSRTCSQCGSVAPEDMPYAVTFTCPTCGLVLERETNAAQNLLAAARAGVVE